MQRYNIMDTIEYLAAFAARYCSIIIVYRMLLFTAMNNRSIEASKIIFWGVVLFFAFSTVTVSLMFDVFKCHGVNQKESKNCI